MVALGSVAFGQSQSGELTRIDTVRQLSRERAQQHLHVRLRGVVTSDVPSPNFVVQDQTGAVYVAGLPEGSAGHRLGDLVEVEGHTDDGFAPIVQEERSRTVGRGSLPDARMYTVSALLGGQMDSQWVSTRGVVRSATIDRTSWEEAALSLHVAGSGGQFEVRVPLLGDKVDPNTFVDREVLVQGVCGSLSNATHQFIGLLFYVPRLRFIKVLGKVNNVPIDSLMQFSPTARAGERTTVQGVVSYWRPGETLFLQNGQFGLRVQTDQTTSLLAGDVVQVDGFPKMGESKPILQDALVRVLGHQEPPAPVELTVTPPFERFDGMMIRSDAKLLHKTEAAGVVTFLLESEKIPFTAVLQRVTDDRFADQFEEGSRVSIRGVCLVRNGGLWRTPESFTILIPSTSDVALLARPTWWNVRHTDWITGLVLTVLAAVCVWTVALRGRLHKQIQLYKNKLSAGAVLEERARIARELHDSLEQDLAGIILQLDLAADYYDKSKNVSRTALDNARTLSRRGMLEARRSVWDMRSQVLEEGDLEHALREMATSLNQRNQGRVVFSSTGNPMTLSKSAELHFLRIAQEAMSNSLKHAHASEIQLQLRQEATCISLRISDNGCGFDPQTSSPDGHFGLLNMKERASAMGSRLEIVSEPGGGTQIEVFAAKLINE